MKDWKRYLSQLRGTTVSFDLEGYRQSLECITALEPASEALSDDVILERGRSLRARARSDESRERIRLELFALAREAARRASRQRAFDEQMLAALALDDGRVVEMQTGEGKTLAAVMPAALNALAGRGVHVLTFNDYLARRDAEWMGPIYRRLGLSVGCVQQGMTPAARRAAYRADVTYVTAKEAGFDHLRDRLVMEPGDLVHRPVSLRARGRGRLAHDRRGARAAGDRRAASTETMSLAPRLASLVASLVAGHALRHRRVRPRHRADRRGHRARRSARSAAAACTVPTTCACSPSSELRAARAALLLRRDVDYIVRDGRIEIVDEFTGRVGRDRHWPDGLQAALEAKEGLERRADGRILGSITLQRSSAAIRGCAA